MLQINIRLFIVGFMAIFLVGCSQLGMYRGWAGPVIEEDKIIIGGSQGRLISINKDTGEWLDEDSNLFEEVWRSEQATGFLSMFSTPMAPNAFYGQPIIYDDAILVATYNGKLAAFEQFAPGGRLSSNEKVGDGDPVVGGVLTDATGVYVASEEGTIKRYRINRNASTRNPIEFEEIQRYKIDGKVWSTPAIWDDILVVTSLDKQIYAFDLETGNPKWNPFVSKGAIVSSPVVSEGVAYVGSFDSIFYALDLSNGSTVWEFTEGNGWYFGTPLIHEQFVYVPSMDGNLYVLDKYTGEKVDQIETKGSLPTSPVIVGSKTDGDYLVFVTREGMVYSVDTAFLGTGDLDPQKCQIEGKVESSIVAENDLVFLYSRKHAVWALSIGKGGRIDEYWDKPFYTDKLKFNEKSGDIENKQPSDFEHNSSC